MKTKFRVAHESYVHEGGSILYFIEYKKWFKWQPLICNDNEPFYFIHKEEANYMVEALNKAKL